MTSIAEYSPYRLLCSQSIELSAQAVDSPQCSVWNELRLTVAQRLPYLQRSLGEEE